jgi:isopenicillin-N epimerase
MEIARPVNTASKHLHGGYVANPFDGTTAVPMKAYGRQLLPCWGLDPAVRHINHGSFGATSRAVLDEQLRWQQLMEANPARFFMTELPGHLRDVAAVIASFVGTEPDRLAFVENATSGTSAVLRGLDFQRGDEILTTDHVYNALRNTIRYVADRTGAILREVAIPVPTVDPAILIEAIRSGINGRTSLVVIDHITSASATTFPVEAIVKVCRERGVPVLVDGAHAPGMIDLDIDAIGADWYVGNCHKWLCAPKGAAFIVVSRAPAAVIHPLAISHAYGQGFPVEFDKIGTRDATAWLSIPAAIRFHEGLGGEVLRARNRKVALAVAGTIASSTGMSAACAPALCQAMVALRLPGQLHATREVAARIHDDLYERHGFEAAITTVGGSLYLRISVQAYNDESDFEGLGEAVLSAVRAVP